jgi:hypothetical protein
MRKNKERKEKKNESKNTGKSKQGINKKINEKGEVGKVTMNTKERQVTDLETTSSLQQQQTER